ncbi:hypothetical protein MIND_01238100 [Mycena indigotica]|uniref:Uncharacterized protein n=1 Tax=Mycena indigotica TaxID=2126181 RepID=A0A8H6S3A2_9AGAR|nr:uncharacterized protein MIND_01238100 [Mycena indigotica]KAF7292114.1 hypothetical protein MIND_01238100 [Mycena indigotica]
MPSLAAAAPGSAKSPTTRRRRREAVKPKREMKIVTERAVYIPPPPLYTEEGLIEATTTLLLQKMIADSYEHGREFWRENKENGHGPNAAQKKVDKWLVSAGLLAPDDDFADRNADEVIDPTPPTTPTIPRPVPFTPSTDSTSSLLFAPSSSGPSTPPSPSPARTWHRRASRGLKIIIPRLSGSNLKSGMESPSSASPRSPLSPLGLSPKRLWKAVQNSTTSLPLPKRPKLFKRDSTASMPPIPASTSVVLEPVKSRSAEIVKASRRPFKPSADPNHSLLETAFKRAAMLQTITADDAQAIMDSHRAPASDREPFPGASWYVPPLPDPMPVSETPAVARGPQSPRYSYVPLEDPRSFRWPSQSTGAWFSPPPSPLLDSDDEDVFSSPSDSPSEEPEVYTARWYHPIILGLIVQLLLFVFTAVALVGLFLRPIMLGLLCYALFQLCQLRGYTLCW